MRLKPIPLRDPEIVEAEARTYWRGNAEKVPTTSLTSLTVCVRQIDVALQQGQRIRGDAARGAASAGQGGRLHPQHVCDSKATRCYDVVLRYDTCTWDANPERYCVGKRLEAALVVVVGGHNGISIEAADRQCGDTHNRVYLDPAWPGFWPYDDDANANA